MAADTVDLLELTIEQLQKAPQLGAEAIGGSFLLNNITYKCCYKSIGVVITRCDDEDTWVRSSRP